MDGISVAASVIGLVGAAAKVTEYLNALVTSARTAPKLAQSVLLEVSDVSICLSQLQRLLLGMEMRSRPQERLIMIEQLVVVLSNCVSVFSELEEILESLDLTSSTPISKIKIARWLHRQQSISTLLIRLQASKQSLTLIVTTLNCTSVAEAENAMCELKALTLQVLESNQVLAERLARLELQHSAYGLSRAPTSIQDEETHYGKSAIRLRLGSVFDDSETSTDPSLLAPNSNEEDQDNESMVTVGRIGPTRSESLPVLNGFAFEQDLLGSRPYARAITRRPCLSATSSVVPTMGWSYLSGLNLTHVSTVSILSLPFSPSELWNGHRYVTARNDLQASEGEKEQQNLDLIVLARTLGTLKGKATFEGDKTQQEQAAFALVTILDILLDEALLQQTISEGDKLQQKQAAIALARILEMLLDEAPMQQTISEGDKEQQEKLALARTMEALLGKDKEQQEHASTARTRFLETLLDMDKEQLERASTDSTQTLEIPLDNATSEGAQEEKEEPSIWVFLHLLSIAKFLCDEQWLGQAATALPRHMDTLQVHAALKAIRNIETKLQLHWQGI